MAEVTGLRNNALNYPVYGAPYGVTLPILDADGDLVTGAAGLDSEISKNGDTFADCTNEATEIATSSGMYYLLLTGTELSTDVATIIVKTSTSGAKTTPMVLYPRKLVTIRSGTSASAGSSTSTIVLDASASAVDDFYNGMVCVATIDGNIEARVISDYVGSTQTASVVPDWNVAPDNNDTFIIELPEGAQMPQADVRAINGLGTDGNNATLKLKQLDVTNSAGDAVVLASTGSNGRGMAVSGNGSGAAMRVTAGATGIGIDITAAAGAGVSMTSSGGNNGGLELYGHGTYPGLHAAGGATGAGIRAVGGGTSGAGAVFSASASNDSGIAASGFGSGAGISTTGGATGAGAKFVGGASSGAGATFTGTAGNADGATFTHQGSGKDIAAPNSDLSGTTVAAVTTVNGLAANVVTAAAIATGAIDADALATDAVNEIADGVWDEAIAGHLTGGTTGAALNSAGSAGDPWGTALPGAYIAGTAGHIVGTALPDIAPGSANGLLRGGTNAATSITTALTANIIGNVTGNLSGSVGSVTTDVGITQAGADKAWGTATRVLTAGTNIVLAKGVGVTGFNDLSAAQVNTEADTALSDVGVTLTVTGRIDAAVSTRATPAQVATELNTYDGPTHAEMTAELATADDATLAAIAALNNLSAATVLTEVNAALDTQLADSIPADGTRPTLRQAIYMDTQFLHERSTSGTTVTVKKVDGSTPLATLTLDDATTPTSITRAT